MSKLPFIIKLMPDELLYSYLLRLSKANDFEDIREFMSAYVFSPTYENKGKKYVAVPYDIRDDLYQFATSATGILSNRVLSFYLKTSLFYGIAPLALRSRTSHYVGLLSKYRNHSKILSHVELMVQELHFCPECMQEEQSKYGFFYYHRAHQMPGVTVCHLHGRTLHVYDGKQGKEMELPLKSYPLPDRKKGLEYALFCKEFLDAEFECDISAIADAIMKRLIELGYSSQNYKTLSLKMKDYLDSMKYSPEHLIRFIRQKDQLHMPSLLTLILYLFEKVSTLKSYLQLESNWKKVFEKTISKKYTILSLWREDIVELQCKDCETRFLSTPHRIFSAWGCPTCDGKLVDQTLFERLFHAESKGDYDLLSDFQGMGNPILIRHRACGKEYSIPAKEFLEHHTKCQCEYSLTETEVRKQIEKLGNFELQSYENSMKPITLFHKDCENTFQVMFHMFMKTPRCRMCQRLKANRTKPEDVFIKDVTDLVGDEYTVLERYVSSNTPIDIRHNFCGTVQKFAPKHFLNGQRCKVCQRRISSEEFAKIISEASIGRYACVKRIPPYNVVVQDTISGEEKTMTARRALQELLRPTPSPILPLKERNLNVARSINQKDAIMHWITKHYAPDKIIMLRTLKVEGLEYCSVKNGIAQLANEGRLERIGTGVYKISKKE